jgi:hypothetical protein
MNFLIFSVLFPTSLFYNNRIFTIYIIQNC